MTLDLNDGSRPSLLELGRRATGEVDGHLDPITEQALEAARGELKPLDMVVLRARAVRVAEAQAHEQAHTAREESGAGWTERLRSWWFVGALVPAMLAMMVVVGGPGETGPTGDRMKGPAVAAGPVHLDFLLLQDGEVQHGGSEVAARPGDQIQFRYEAAGFEDLVLLSVDGAGKRTVFWPESGEVPELVEPSGEHLLDGSLILDDAPGPEAFVAVFGTEDVSSAEALLTRAWDDGGLEALERLAREDPAVDLVIVERAR